eukprot:SAG31_NODE_43288_length_267_cov_2.130952_1_plen_58_part_10
MAKRSVNAAFEIGLKISAGSFSPQVYQLRAKRFTNGATTLQVRTSTKPRKRKFNDNCS